MNQLLRGILFGVAMMLTATTGQASASFEIDHRCADVVDHARTEPMHVSTQVDPNVPFETWLQNEMAIAYTKMLSNIAPVGTSRGVVVASPEQVEPNYFFHWVRDSALVMDVIAHQYALASGDLKQHYFHMMDDYTMFSRSNQLADALTGLGEPKFYVDGRPFDLDWGRPQNDGAALRSLTLIRFARQLLSEGQSAYVQAWLYDSQMPATTVIKADLEYVASHWSASSFDVWEEVRGDHFYTRMVQLSALREGAVLARQLNDLGAANFYETQARAIQNSLTAFWDMNAGFIRVTLNRAWGSENKVGLDSAVILGVLHADLSVGDYTILDSRVLATAVKIDAAFAPIYAINQSVSSDQIGTAIGRYPEDVYEGNRFNCHGNPWVLTTAALAELNYRLAAHLAGLDGLAPVDFLVDSYNLAFVQKVSGFALGRTRVVSGLVIRAGSREMAQLISDLRSAGDLYLKRVRLHANADGSLSEQIQRDTGFMTSARDLTWSYASLITAGLARP